MRTKLTDSAQNSGDVQPMKYASLQDFLQNGKQALSNGPVAIVLVEDDVEIATTLRHHLDAGFREVLALMPDQFELSDDLGQAVHRISYNAIEYGATEHAVNLIIEAAPGTWFYYSYNAEPYK